MTTAQGDNRARLEIERLRRGSRQGGGDIMGYNADGGPREVAGDEDGPFHKVPPFPRNFDLLLDEPDLPIRDFGISEEFDVSAVRLLTVWIEYTPVDDDSVLGLAPEVRITDQRGWFPIGAIDAAIDVLEIDSVKFGSRLMYPAVFVSPTVGPDMPFRHTIQFDVGPYRQLRFKAGNFTQEQGMQAGGALVLHGSVSE